MNKKKIMIVGGTIYQIPIIKKAKQLGYYIINVDGNLNSPAFKFADEYIIVNILDYEKVLEIAKNYKIDGIITDQSDISLRTTSYVGQKMNLPSISSNMLKIFTNKYLMRVYLKNNGFNYPKFKLCNKIQDVYDFANQFGYPFVIKPLDSRGSNGVNLINNHNEIKEYFYIALSENIEATNILVEEYIQGDDYVLDGIKIKDKHYTLAVGKKNQYLENSMVTQSIYYSKEVIYPNLVESNNLIIEKTGLDFGNTHAEYKYKNGEIYLIEFAARGGGAYISSHIVPYISGVDTTKILLQYCTNSSIDIIKTNDSQNLVGLVSFFNFKPGIVKKITGIDEIKKIQGVLKCIINISEGDKVDKIKNGGNRIGEYIICTSSQADIIKIKNKIDSILNIEFF